MDFSDTYVLSLKAYNFNAKIFQKFVNFTTVIYANIAVFQLQLEVVLYS